MLYIFPIYQAKINEIAGYRITSLDGRFSYTKAEVDKVFNDMGIEGRKVNQFVSGVVDMIYPLVYGLLFFLVLTKLTNSFSNHKIKLVCLVPMIAILFDYLENFGVLIMLNEYPEITKNQVTINSILTSTKWGFVLIAFISTLVLGIFKLFNRERIDSRE